MPDSKVIITENLEMFADQLSDPSVYDQVDYLVDFVTSTRSIGESFELLRKLEPIVSKSKLSPEFSNKYRDLILQLKFTTLPVLEPNEVSELHKKNLLFALKNDIDVKDRIKRLILRYSGTTAEGGIKNNLVQAIDTNAESLGNVAIAEILKQYKSTLKSNSAGTLEVAQFMVENKTVQQLDEDSKKLLKEVLSVYNWVRFGSNTGNVNIAPTPKTVIIPDFVKPVSKPSFNPAPQRSVVIPEAMPVSKPISDKPKFQQSSLTVPKWVMPEEKVNPTPAVAAPINISKPVPRPPTKSLNLKNTGAVPNAMLASQGKSVNEIKTLDDLRLLQARDIRQGTLNAQIELIKSKVYDLVRNNSSKKSYAIVSFEQSSLFKSYLSTGALLVSNQSGDLNKAEFEAVADLKRFFEQL